MTSRDRFPGLSYGWARLDGAAGTLMVDTAIDAMTDFMRSPAASNMRDLRRQHRLRRAHAGSPGDRRPVAGRR